MMKCNSRAAAYTPTQFGKAKARGISGLLGLGFSRRLGHSNRQPGTFRPREWMGVHSISASEFTTRLHRIHRSVLLQIIWLLRSVDPAKVVTKEEFEAKVAATYAKYNVIETPPAEKKILADLLGLTPEALGKTGVWFPEGGDVCASCGRAITFLDVAAGGLKAHSKEFMADIITGKHGYVLNSDPQPISCHSCGDAAAIGNKYGYTSGDYHCEEA
ncbi:hypothetical protein C8R45DRAFT_942924 [Mycena sanguinolenta]|nr:hypothetical protein C8R45DRAFT_942924 [Mycena sanguinolenta]